jgi:nitroreductase
VNIIDAINARKSIRGFKTDPVDPATIKKILEAAVRAPSAMNTQPWEFFVITGTVLDQIREQIVEKLNTGAPMQPDHQVVGWPDDSVYRKRQVDLAKQLFFLMDIRREDKKNGPGGWSGASGFLTHPWPSSW